MTAAPKRILVAKIGPLGVSETFIRDHVERLPAEVVLHDDAPKPHPHVFQALVRRTGWAGVDYRRYWNRVLAEHRPDVVLAEFGHTGTAIRRACRRASVPLVVHFHGSDAWVQANVRGQRHTYPRLFRDAAAVVAPSKSMANRLVAIGAPAAKVRLVRCGIDVRLFTPADIASTPVHFVGIGRFIEIKRHDCTIRAFAQTRRHFPDARLTIVGDGPLRSYYCELIREHGLGGSVHLPGPLSQERIRSLFATARAFVHHPVTMSDGAVEGAPVVIAEAQAAGVPVVATNNDGIPEMVENGVSGYLVDEWDVPATAEAMCRLAADARLAGALGRAGRARVVREQSIEQTIARLWDVLREACASEG